MASSYNQNTAKIFEIHGTVNLGFKRPVHEGYIQGVVGETLNPPVCPLETADQFQQLSGFPTRPFVLLSRYRDNIYVAFANIPLSIRPAVQFACAALLRTIYQLPLKWEQHGAAVVWGEGMIRTGLPGVGFSLLRKGTSSCLQQVVDG